MERYEIVGKIHLDFIDQEQYTIAVGPGDGYLLRRGHTIYFVTTNGTEETINTPGVVDTYLERGALKFVGQTKQAKVDVAKAQEAVRQSLSDLHKFMSKDVSEKMAAYFIDCAVCAIESVVCKAETCENEARYTSGYCGICDIQHNEGRGERR